ncbi:MAG: ATP-binding protein, partial [Candidatus Eremiobacteraeota bacterium]|nr:ATP-binding protein [Candidatus Eremiobacteraeota bacterium]
MDVSRPMQGENELDARQQLQADLDSARAERDGMERAIASDTERIANIRTALDAMIAAVWRDVCAQQQRAKRDDIWMAAVKLEWLGSMQFPSIGVLLVVAVASTFAFHVAGAAFSAALYGVFFVGGYFTARDQSLAQLKKARRSYLGDDGRDVRFVAFTHCESGLHHPLIGFDGPRKNGSFAARSWKIPGVRDDEALKEVFVEVIDERHASVLLTRFPEKKPTLVHADLENPFIRAYGVFFQRALERQMPAVAAQAEEFRQAVLRAGEMKKLGERCLAIETELREFDGTQAIMSNVPLSMTVRNKLVRQIVLFRMADPSVRRGMMLFAQDGFDLQAIVETVARAAAATFVPFSFSSLKIGYVGQGAAQVARAFDTARRSRSVLYIEDGDKLFNNTGASGFEPMRREIQQAFLKQWDALDDRSNVWLIAAVHDRDSIDPTVIAHFGTLVDLTPQGRDAATAMEEIADRPIFEESFQLPEGATEKVRVLSAMFAHVRTMERQGITVPRGVLLAASSAAARRAVSASLTAQSGLKAVH